MDAAEKVLAHFGVKGMKWGVRKSRTTGTPPEHQSEMAQRKHEALAKIKKHGLDAATNDDLKMLEQRVKLETKFNELFPKKKSPLQKALDFGAEEAKKILLPIAEQQAKDYLSKQVTKKLLGPAVPVKQNTSAKTIDSVLKVVGDHKIADQPKKLPHFGFA